MRGLMMVVMKDARKFTPHVHNVISKILRISKKDGLLRMPFLKGLHTFLDAYYWRFMLGCFWTLIKM
jgi:hypothetical protein